MLTALYADLSREAQVLLCLGVMLLSGFLAAQLARLLGLPGVSGYLAAGGLIGPWALGAVPVQVLPDLDILSDMALAFMAFGVGSFFRKEALRKRGAPVVPIALMESFAAGILVAAVMAWGFRLGAEASLLLGAVAMAVSPAGTTAILRPYRGEGDFLEILLQAASVGGVVSLTLFSIAAAVVHAVEIGETSSTGAALAVVCHLALVFLAILLAIVLARRPASHSGGESRAILAAAFLLVLSGICTVLDLSPLLSCMVFGAVYVEMSRDRELYRQLNVFAAPVMLLFFVEEGIRLDLRVLAGAASVAAGYLLLRIVGKCAGAWLGCVVTGTERRLRAPLGAALMPQAGVAVGLGSVAQRILPRETGAVVMSVVVAASVVYELIGPGCARGVLLRAGVIRRQEEPAKEPKGRRKGTPVRDGTDGGTGRSPIINKVLLPYRGNDKEQ